MNTVELIEKFLISIIGRKHQLNIVEYKLDGSSIFIEYSYNPQYDWDLTYISYGNEERIDLLDYITFLYTNK